jgi:hypothetical protein
MTTPVESSSTQLISRVQNIMLSPRQEWMAINAEQKSVTDIFVQYTLILSVIAALSGFVKSTIIGYSFFGVSTHLSFMGGLFSGFYSFMAGLLCVFVIAFVINFLAPHFGGQKNFLKAYQVATYSMTAAWIAQTLCIIPILGLVFMLGGLYSLYLLYLGISALMKAPENKNLPYTITVVLITTVFVTVLLTIFNPMPKFSRPIKTDINASEMQKLFMGGTTTLPDGTTISMYDLQKKALGAQQHDTPSVAPTMAPQEPLKPPKKLPAVSVEDLKGFIPQSLPAGYARESIHTISEPAHDTFAGTTIVVAVFKNGAASIELILMDYNKKEVPIMPEVSEERADSYNKAGMVNGVYTAESFNKTSRQSNYMQYIGGRFNVAAHGVYTSMEETKAAVDSVNKPALEKLSIPIE